MSSESVKHLNIQSTGNIPLFKVRGLLDALEHSYNYIYVAEMLLSNPRDPDLWSDVYDEGEKRFARWVPAKDRLILVSVELHSPGYWSFLGSLNPLETIRKYLQDRHERRKDKKYREAEEQRSMGLDNDLKEAQIFSVQIDNARKMGATIDDFRPMLDRFVRQPLQRLDRFQDDGTIGRVSLSEANSPDLIVTHTPGRRSIILPESDDEKNKHRKKSD